ncbi:MAG: endonuclease NucS [Limnohabitans sp.]|nr:endonuclease NucS [Limnohabitans sp.]
MKRINICNEQFEKLLEQAKVPTLTETEVKEIEKVRQDFLQNYNLGRIYSLTEEDYFSDFNKEGGCFEFDLEVTTKILGDIQSSFANKYGQISDFPVIKSIFQKIIWLDASKAYEKEGSISVDFDKIVLLSREIADFENDKKVLPKLLSIFFPDVFIPVFDHQEIILKKLLVDAKISEKNGLGNYVENNFDLLTIKRKLESELGMTINSYEFSKLLNKFIAEEADTVALQHQLHKNAIIEERLDTNTDFSGETVILDASNNIVNSYHKGQSFDSVGVANPIVKESRKVEQNQFLSVPTIEGVSIDKGNFAISNLEDEKNLISLKAEFSTNSEKINYNEKTTMTESISKLAIEEFDIQTCQILLHKNRTKLLPNLRYYDNEKQLLVNGQFDTGVVGVMDMLTVDENGNFVVIEFKREKKDESLGRILRYMGWLKSELCNSGQSVKGIIISNHNDLNLMLISKAVSNLSFLKLTIDISLTEQK